MSDLWRVKKYYRPRVLIPVSDVLENPFPGRLVSLSGAQVNLLRNLVAYAHRRSTFVSSYRERDYLAPDTTEWDGIQSVVAELEALLMTDCCDELTTRLDTLIAQGENGADVLADLQDWMTAAEAYLDCICEESKRAASAQTVNITWPPTDAPPTWLTYDNSDANQTIPTQAQEDACGLAQAWYQAGFELITERFLPAFRFGWNALQQALVAAITIATGGAGIPIAFGVFVTAELVQALLDLAYDASQENIYNWMVANKEEVICALYQELQGGGSTSEIWETVYNDLISGAAELSDGDELLMRVLGGNLAAGTAKAAKEADTDWYQAAVTPGYCAVCPLEPVVGSNWVAVPVLPDDGFLRITKPSSAGVTLCNKWNVPSGRTVCGYVLNTTERTGDIHVKFMNAQEWGCGATLTYTTNGVTYAHPLGYKYVCNTANHNYTEAVAELCAGASVLNIGIPRTGPVLTGIAYLTEGSQTGQWTAQNDWIVYTGTAVPPKPWY